MLGSTRSRTLVGSLFLSGLVALTGAAHAQDELPSWDGAWTGVDATDAMLAAEAWVRPNHYSLFRADLHALARALSRAPLEGTDDAREAPAIVSVPMPDGSYQAFEIVESPIMAPQLQNKYPEIRTYLGQGIDDDAASIRLDLTPHGFHAQVLGPNGRVLVDPFNRRDRGLYASYYTQDTVPIHDFVCEGAIEDGAPHTAGGGPAQRTGDTLRTYRLANAATGEYTQFHGGTVQDGMAAIVTAVNRVTGIYEVEVAVRMELVPNNDLIVFTNPNTDPYTNNNGGAMLQQNVNTCNSRIGSNNYDIGHVFSTGGGGVAYLGVVCRSNKAGGVTGLPAPRGDGFYVDYVAHEMGHQFGANHCFNSSTSGCSGNRSGSNAYEPGSASTIMGYAGLCGSDNIQNFSDPYFGSNSYDAMRNYTQNSSGNNCAARTATGNTEPFVFGGLPRTIPIGTPFRLTATGSDPDGDTLTYNWEERDRGPSARLTDPDDGQFPLNRSYNATLSPTRVVPRMSVILANTTDRKDRLPEVSRTYEWRVTARDNRAGGGGIAYAEVEHVAAGNAGPFDVTGPSGGQTWQGSGTVVWDVANTTAAPVSCGSVNILLSTDGGTTFPYVLASDTPNDGSETVNIPANIESTEARIMVEAADNIFFDINPAEFTIVYSPPLFISLPDGAVNVMEPGQSVDFAVQIDAGTEGVDAGTEKLFYSYDGGGFASVNLVAQGGGLYTATLPAASCSDTPSYYVEATGDQGSVVRLPENAPADTFVAGVGEYSPVETDDFEADTGWAVQGDASGGAWERVVPNGYGLGDPDADADGSGRCYVTGAGLFDEVNGGTTTLVSPAYDMSDGGALGYSFWLNTFGASLGAGDGLFVDVATNSGGTNWTQLRAYTTAEGAWRTDTIAVGAEVPASSTVRLRFRAVDAAEDNVVEAGVDAFVRSEVSCDDDGCIADFNGDGEVNTLDVLEFLNAYTAGDPSADVNGDGEVNTLDVLEFLNAWTAGC